jgi:putative membrane protein
MATWFDRSEAQRPTTRSVAQWIGDYGLLSLLSVVTVAALAGYTTFRLRPDLLSTIPGAIPVYAAAFTVFARTQIALAFAALAFFLWRHAGTRWLSAFAAIYAISLASELLGTTVGLPFGPYQYTEALGIRWFGHVPVLIPMSWFFMAIPSYALARSATASSTAGSDGRTHRIRRIALASLLLLTWDLSLDPAMSTATRYWVWGSDGAYYGMPLLNLAGWYITGLALMAALSALRADGWLRDVPRRWLTIFYGVNLLLPIGMSIASGMWAVALVTGIALAVCGVLIERWAPEPSRAQLHVVP